LLIIDLISSVAARHSLFTGDGHAAAVTRLRIQAPDAALAGVSVRADDARVATT
jgi:hypothetical protein